jgi:hypothetical protein
MKAFRRLDVRTAFDKWTPNFLVLSLLGWAFWPIIDSALQGDDVPNSMRSAVLRSVSQSRWTAITQSVGQWLKNEGRFFPVSAIENVYLFSTIHSVTLYKFCQWLSVIVLIALFSWFATSMSGVRQFYPLFLLAIGAAIQTRNWYDPTFGFGLLLQSTFLKVVLSAILLHRVVTRKPTKFALVTSTTRSQSPCCPYSRSLHSSLQILIE